MYNNQQAYHYNGLFDMKTVLSLQNCLKLTPIDRHYYAATVEICESNGVGETVTHNITDSDMSTEDSATTDPVANSITPGNRSMAKYQRLHVTAMGGSSKVLNIQVWRTGALGGAATHVTNARTSGYVQKSYAQPVTSSITNVDQAMPTSDPAAANLGISGSLTNELLATGYTDYLVHQLITNGADTAGSTSTMNYQYDEIA
jgi:hypothetical protein